MKARDYLRQHISEESKSYFGFSDEDKLEMVVDAWMDDKNNSKHRFDDIKSFLPEAKTILDLASGCGTAVFYGLNNNYNVYGIDPEEWKYNFIKIKAKEYDYPTEYIDKFNIGVGENLPFTDNFFDCITSYQTLEHVQDPERVISEMIRATRVTGGIHIRCPDYRGTYEGHYQLPWLPLFPRILAKLYLKLMGKPTKGLETIQYMTIPRIKRALEAIKKNQPELVISIININDRLLLNSLKNSPISANNATYLFLKIYRYIKALFRKESTINMFVLIERK